jgi:hypothetical protein
MARRRSSALLDAPGDGVLGVALRRRRQGERLVRGDPPARGGLDHPELAAGQRAGLVEEHGGHVARVFQPAAIANQEPVAGGEGGGDGHDQRDREPERVRTRDHQHRDDPLDHERGRPSHQGPRDHGDAGRDDGHDGQEECRAVREGLRARARALGLGYEAHDAGEGRLLPGAGDFDAERARGVHRPRDDGAAGLFPERSRLPGDHGLVDLAGAVPDRPVRGNAGAGSHEHEIAVTKRRDGNGLGAVGHDPFGAIREELGELLKRSLRLGDRAHLDPVAEHHDGDQRGELPPEVHPREAERHREAPAEGHRDRQRDERHHAGEASRELADRGADEDPAAVGEDQYPEQGRDPSRRRRSAPRRVPEPMLDHRRPRQGGDREQQRSQELAAEHLDRVSRVRVVAGVAFGVRGRPGSRRSMRHGLARAGRRLMVAVVPAVGVGSAGRSVAVRLGGHGWRSEYRPPHPASPG